MLLFANILMWVTFYVYGVRKYEIHNQSKVEETFFESLRKNMKISAKYPCTCKSTTKMIIILCTNQGTNKNIFVFFQRYLNILFIYVLVRYTCIYAPLYVVKCGLVCEIWQKKILESLSFTQLCTWKFFFVNVFKSFLSCHKILSYHSIFKKKTFFMHVTSICFSHYFLMQM